MKAFFRNLGLVSGAVLIMLALVFLAIYRPWSAGKEPTAKEPGRVSDKLGSTLKLKSPLLAESYGIKAEPAREIVWQPRLWVDGRVLANPQALIEVRAPFAGLITGTSSGSWFRLGAPVEAQQKIATLEGRFNLVEKLDLRSKRLEAEAKYRSAEEVLKIRQERGQRLTELAATGSVSRSDLDTSAIQLSEARMLKEIALAQWSLWKQALESADKTNIALPIVAPLAGEIAEIGAQPGAHVEAGQLLVRIVDFKKILMRFDFPLGDAGLVPPRDIEVETLSVPLASTCHWRAALQGPAPTLEVGLQKAGYLYEIVDPQQSPKWRPGLYVRASVLDPAGSPQPAVVIPAESLLLHQGRTLVYVELNVGRYERREVSVLGREGDTFIVSPRGWTSTTDKVVTKHPQALLSEEFRSDVDDD